jgi:hypothetical protein
MLSPLERKERIREGMPPTEARATVIGDEQMSEDVP